MKSFTLEQIAQITGGLLSKAEDVTVTKIAPPVLADESTLALALGEEEIANLASSKAKAALVPLGVNIDGYSPVVINETPITSFYNICQDFEFQYYIDGDSDYGKIKKLGFTAPIVSKNVNANIFWKKIKNMTDGQKRKKVKEKC